MKTSSQPMTGIILARNTEAIIERAIQSLHFCREIIVLNNRSTDTTREKAQAKGARVIMTQSDNFAENRNEGLRQATYNWILYLDADEVIPPALAAEIQTKIYENKPGAYLITRKNIFLGRPMYQDEVERLFHKTVLLRWEGEVHEHPVITRTVNHLKQEMLHYTHTDITSMLSKTNNWSQIEAGLRFQAHHPQVVWWRLIRIALTMWWEQLIHKRVWRYGREGWFEGYFQMIDKLIVYTKLWELQHEKDKI